MRTPRATSLKALNYALLVVVGVLVAVPLFWLLTSAVKPSDEIYRWPMTWIPSRLEWTNFVDAWTAAPFGSFFVNSLVVTAVGAGIKLVLALTSAYAFTFLRFPAKDALFLVLLGALMVPGHVTLLVNYLTVSSLGWLNTYAGLIVPGIASVLGTFLLRQYMMTIPRELVEAATMDGAGHLRILATLVMPLAKPSIITVGLIAVIDEWNGFIWPLIVTNTVEMRTLPVGLLFLKDNEGLSNWGAIMAGTTMVAVPVLLLFFIAQRYIVAGLTQGAVKG